MIIEKGKDYEVKYLHGMKVYNSKEAHYVFNPKTGFTVTWGKTPSEDPMKFPSPNILDLEITTKCTGGCEYCFPAGTSIQMEDGTMKNIEDIKVGDEVKSYRGKYHQAWRKNKVIETYERDYSGDLICIELENGNYIEVTPNHPILTKRGWVEAGNLKEDDDVICNNGENKTYICENCGKPTTKPVLDLRKSNGYLISDRAYPTFCSEDCKESFAKQHLKICPVCKTEFESSRNKLFCEECNRKLNLKGKCKHHLWNLYTSMLQRCYNSKNISYKFYGAVGKVVDDRRLNFNNFLEDMESTWFPGATLDRIDNNKGYSKENCRWVTKDEQRTNRKKFKSSTREWKHICKTPAGNYLVGGPKINEDNGNKVFKTLEEALSYRNNRYKEKYPNSYELYIKE